MSNLVQPLSGVISGERIGSATAVQLPTVACSMVYIRASIDNTGNVSIGPSTVTLLAGSTTTTAGYTLAAGESIGPLPLDNLNRLYMICTSTADCITYLCLA